MGKPETGGGNPENEVVLEEAGKVLRGGAAGKPAPLVSAVPIVGWEIEPWC